MKQQLEAWGNQLGRPIPVRSLIHVGANTGQEVEAYEQAGIRGHHIEAMPAPFETLQAACAKTALQTPVLACCDAEAGREVSFTVASNSQSSSLLPLGRHQIAHPAVKPLRVDTLTTTTLDHLVAEGAIPADPDFLVLDVQGAEWRVLSGAERLLAAPTLLGMNVEITAQSGLYDGDKPVEELYVEHIRPAGFFLKAVNVNRHGWGMGQFFRRWWLEEGEAETPFDRAVAAGTARAA